MSQNNFNLMSCYPHSSPHITGYSQACQEYYQLSTEALFAMVNAAEGLVN
jgi:hypothetical protein